MKSCLGWSWGVAVQQWGWQTEPSYRGADRTCRNHCRPQRPVQASQGNRRFLFIGSSGASVPIGHSVHPFRGHHVHHGYRSVPHYKRNEEDAKDLVHEPLSPSPQQSRAQRGTRGRRPRQRHNNAIKRAGAYHDENLREGPVFGRRLLFLRQPTNRTAASTALLLSTS